MQTFIHMLLHYLREIIPALAIGFFISGLVHEFMPEDKVLKYLGQKGIKPILYSTVIGAFLPVCCWGSLPIAVSFYKKGAGLGPILAFLVATPATSISALLVAYSVLGPLFTVYIFFAVIIMGVTMGLVGNALTYEPKIKEEKIPCPHCELSPEHAHAHKSKALLKRITSVLKYAYIKLPKEIGVELFIGLALAVVVATFVPIGQLIKSYLGGWFGYAFSIVFGVLMYICSTATVPLVDSLIKQGMNPGAGMTLLLIGPVTSYGTILVLRKEYGMKILAIFLSCLIFSSLLLGFGFQSIQRNTSIALGQERDPEGTVTLSGAWAIYPTAVAWAEAFQKKHPKVRIDVSAGGAGKGAADAISGLVDIGMVSRDPDPSEINKGIVPIYILHDAVFPVISDKNPALQELLKKGIKKRIWSGIYITGLITTWDKVVDDKVNRPIHLYTRSDSCGAAASWAAYLSKKQEDLRGVGVYGDPGLLEAAKRDPVGIGYSNFSYVFTREGNVVQGAKLVPIDSNENGIADPDEIYENRATAIGAIRSGRYPATRKNWFFVKGKPEGLTKEFIEFALSDEGTKIVMEVGTSLDLSKAEREKVLKEIWTEGS